MSFEREQRRQDKMKVGPLTASKMMQILQELKAEVAELKVLLEVADEPPLPERLEVKTKVKKEK